MITLFNSNEKGNHYIDDSYGYTSVTGTGPEFLDIPLFRTVEHGRSGSYRGAGLERE